MDFLDPKNQCGQTFLRLVRIICDTGPGCLSELRTRTRTRTAGPGASRSVARQSWVCSGQQ